MGLVLFDYVVGGGWDAAYHETQPFDGFFSPPHLFIYTVAAFVLATVAVLTVTPRLRACFGATVRVPVLGLEVPGALLLLDAGCAGLAVAGVADAAWHTAFGLDETQWSFPHALLGASLVMIVMGFVSCRRALARWLPVWPLTWYLFGYLLAFGLGTFLGPLWENPTREAVQVAGGLGALGDDEAYQHLVRVAVAADLTHANPAFVVLGALWAGLAIGLLRALDARTGFWLVVAVGVGLSLQGSAEVDAERLGLGTDTAVATGPPLLTAVLAFAAAGRWTDRTRFLVAGIAFALHAVSVWGAVHPAPYAVAALAAPPAAVLGGRLAGWIWSVLARPARPATWALILGWLLAVPALTGTVDLALRLAIP